MALSVINCQSVTVCVEARPEKPPTRPPRINYMDVNAAPDGLLVCFLLDCVCFQCLLEFVRLISVDYLLATVNYAIFFLLLR